MVGIISAATVLRRYTFGQGKSGFWLRWRRFDWWPRGVGTEGRMQALGEGVMAGKLKVCSGVWSWVSRISLPFFTPHAGLAATSFFSFPNSGGQIFVVLNRKPCWFWCSLNVEILNRDFPCWVNVELGCSQDVGMCPHRLWSCLWKHWVLSIWSSWPIWEPVGSGQASARFFHHPKGPFIRTNETEKDRRIRVRWTWVWILMLPLNEQVT